jgi:hypothetical protein
MRALAGRGVAAVALAAVGALGLAPTRAEAFACTRTGIDRGPSLTWQSRTIRFAIDAALTADFDDPDAVRSAVRRSLDAWSRVDCSDLDLVYGDEKRNLRTTSDPLAQNENVIVFVTSDWRTDRRVIALTTTAYRPQSGELYDADVELNDVGFRFVDASLSCSADSGAMDLENTLVHELGHTIGLDHPPSEVRFEGSTMYASAEPCETQKRTLADDDAAGICSIYPAGRPAQPCFGPEKVTFEVVDTTVDGGCGVVGVRRDGALAAGALLALVMRRRRARRPG